jgi:hypothetical protein
MPEIGRVSGAVIRIYSVDHPPPHVHVRYQGREVRFDIIDAAPLDPTTGFHARVLADVRDWLRTNRDTVMMEWTKHHG